jgi:hypothetical protein
MSNLTPNAWLLILFTVVPGFVANRVYSLWCPGQKQDWEKALLEPLTWSAVNLVFWGWLVVQVLQTPFERLDGWLSVIIAVVCVVSPTVLASAWYFFRKWKWTHQRLGWDHPTPRGWDFFLHQYRNFFVLFHLKDKRMVGGYFGACSYASTYPQDPEIYVEQIWRVDQESGEFLEPVDGSCGSVIRQSEWERIDFLKVPNSEIVSNVGRGTPADHQGDSGRDASTSGGLPGDCQPEQLTGGQLAQDNPAPGRIGDGTPEKPATPEVGTNHVAAP